MVLPKTGLLFLKNKIKAIMKETDQGMVGAVSFLILNFANIAAASHIFLNDAFMGIGLFIIIDRYQ